MNTLTKKRNAVFKEVMKREGGKSKLKIGDLREVWKILKNIVTDEMMGTDTSSTFELLLEESQVEFKKRLKSAEKMIARKKKSQKKAKSLNKR